MDCKAFQILQINAQKRPAVMHTVVNDESLRNFGAILISEPHVWRHNEGRAILTPKTHHNWIKTEPSILNNEGRWPYRSMIWTRADLEIEQVQVISSDITAVVIRLPRRQILLLSVYVHGSDTEALRRAINKINQVISSKKTRCSALGVIVAGDFNRHDILWGGTADYHTSDHDLSDYASLSASIGKTVKVDILIKFIMYEISGTTNLFNF